MRNAEEWDYVDVLPQHENPRPRIAGNYGSASNIWHMGMVSSRILPRDQYFSTVTEYADLIGSAYTI